MIILLSSCMIEMHLSRNCHCVTKLTRMYHESSLIRARGPIEVDVLSDILCIYNVCIVHWYSK
jgi:hypothetical protein